MRESGRASGRLDRYRSDRVAIDSCRRIAKDLAYSDNPASTGVSKKRHAWRSSRYARYKIRRASCSIDYAARRVGAADLGTAKFAGGAGKAGGGHAAQRPLATGRLPPLAERRAPEAGMQCSGPLRRGGIAGQGGEKDGPQRAPCAGGRAGGRQAERRPPRGEGAAGRVGGSGVPARSRTRALQDPGHSALRRLQNVTPRNAARGTQKSSLRLGIGSYGSSGRLAAGYLVRLGAWARPGWRGRGGGAAAAGVRPSSRQDSAPSRRAADAARLAAPPGRASRPPPPIPSSGIQCRVP